MKGICRLCRVEAGLCESHIVPKFVFRHIKRTSATGNIRSSYSPNRKIQDGIKRDYLCTDCEENFSRLETYFSRAFYHPFHDDCSYTVGYDDRLIRFAVSLSWRVLFFYIDETDMTHFSPSDLEAANCALDRWRRFLLLDLEHPAEYEQHLIPVNYIVGTDGNIPATGINHYLMRSVDIDCIRSKRECLVFTKLPGFFFLGFLRKPLRKRWKSTKINLKRGCFSLGGKSIPGEFGDYMNRKAELMTDLNNTLSPKQREKAEASLASKKSRRCHPDGNVQGGETRFRTHGQYRIRRRS